MYDYKLGNPDYQIMESGGFVDYIYFYPQMIFGFSEILFGDDCLNVFTACHEIVSKITRLCAIINLVIGMRNFKYAPFLLLRMQFVCESLSQRD